MKNVMKMARMLALFGQLGFTVVTPPVVLSVLANWLRERFLLGTWIMLLAIVLGLAASVGGVVQYCRRVAAFEKKQEREEGSKTVAYYRHE